MLTSPTVSAGSPVFARVRKPTAPNASKLKLDLADRLELGSRLRKYRETLGMTTLEVAEKVLGYRGSHAAVSRLERGVFETVNRDHLAELARFYGTTVSGLLDGTSCPEVQTELPEVSGAWREADIRPGLHGRLRDLRQALGLTAREMAAHLGHINTTMVQVWESGEVVPNPDTLIKIATAFGVSSSWLILGQKAKVTKPTQSMRLRSLRHMAGISRIQLAIKADPQDFVSMRSSIARAECLGCKLDPQKLELVARAFDVPMSFLDPDGLSFDANEASLARAISQQPDIPATLLKLIKQLTTMHEIGLLNNSDIADIHKMIAKKAWPRKT